MECTKKNEIIFLFERNRKMQREINAVLKLINDVENEIVKQLYVDLSPSLKKGKAKIPKRNAKNEPIIYQPPKAKEATVHRSYYMKKDSHYYPHFIAQTVKTTLEPTNENKEKICNFLFGFDNRKFKLQEKIGSKFPIFIVAFDKTKLVFGDFYKLLAPGSAFFIGPKLGKNFKIESGLLYMILST